MKLADMSFIQFRRLSPSGANDAPAGNSRSTHWRNPGPSVN
jgi:hypothetical protein